MFVDFGSTAFYLEDVREVNKMDGATGKHNIDILTKYDKGITLSYDLERERDEAYDRLMTIMSAICCYQEVSNDSTN